jgi:peptidylprolyl isomerase
MGGDETMGRITITLLVFAVCAAAGSLPARAQEEQNEKKEDTPVKAPREIAVVKTSLGSFQVELYAADAPKTVENFIGLARKGFFNGMRVHRVARGFVIQTGDEKSKDLAKMREWGTGGQSIWGGTFADELNPKTPSYERGYVRGTVAMANRGRNTNTSQFFVMLRDLPSMPKNYSIFGFVVEGMDVVDKIGGVEIVPVSGPTDGRPKTDVILEDVTIRTEQSEEK